MGFALGFTVRREMWLNLPWEKSQKGDHKMDEKKTDKKNKHLTAEDREEIEACLMRRMSFKDIGKLIGKDPTTISYEIKHHRVEHRNSFVSTEEPCTNLLRAPFVCNGCPKKSSAACHFVRFYYRAAVAQNDYKKLLSEAREGIPLNKQAFYETDRIITDGLKKGQHIYHIMANSPQITCSKSTVYRHFHKGYYSASVVALPRLVKFKARKAHKRDYVPSGVKIGRTHDDYLEHLENHHLEHHTELDTVIGRIGGKVIMTIHFTSCNCMVGLLLDNKSAAEGAAKFSAFKSRLREAGISIPDLFEVLLADNGGEFADVFSFENDENGHREIPLFFCDPMRSSQKPQIEKNHTLFRDIVPKGSSFDDFTQETVNLIFSHVNSVSRAIYCGKTPYELFSFLYGEKILTLMGLKRIPPDHVIQSPVLLKGIANLKKNL